MTRSLALLASAMLACGGSSAGSSVPLDEHFFRGEAVLSRPSVTDFTLTDHRGERFRFADQRGRVVLVFFGYVHCPDICPAALSTWSKVAQRLGSDRDQVGFVFVTVDPERDTPARLEEHLEIFGSDFIGLVGSAEELEGLYRAFGVRRRKVHLFDGPAGYVVDHTSQSFLVDPAGQLRLQYAYDARSEDLLADVRWLLDHRGELLRQEEPPAISIGAVWSRPTALSPAAGADDSNRSRPPGVVYLSITNEGEHDDRLVAVRTKAAEIAEIHRTTVELGQARMAPVRGGVEIPAGETVVFAPGGLHIMLLGLRRDLLTGEQLGLELEFRSGASVAVSSSVRAP